MSKEVAYLIPYVRKGADFELVCESIGVTAPDFGNLVMFSSSKL
jgi:hypothetical protein